MKADRWHCNECDEWFDQRIDYVKHIGDKHWTD